MIANISLVKELQLPTRIICVQKKLLYEKSIPVLISNKFDARPQIPHDVYEYRVKQGRANPFGIISYGLNIHSDVLYSAQLPMNNFHKARLIISSILKKGVRYNGRVLSVSHVFYDNFYHFSLECLMKIFLLREHLEQESTKILMPQRELLFHKEWFELLHLSDKVLRIKDTEVVCPSEIVGCNFPANSSNQHIGIINDFRAWVLKTVEPVINTIAPKFTSTELPKKIFIGRKAGTRRNIKNVEEVVRIFSRHGFAYLEMDNIPLKEQIAMFHGATHIAGVHGAALSHIIFAKKDARIIELVNKELHLHFFEKICAALSMPSYYSLRCAQVTSQADPNHADIEVDTCHLEAVLSAIV